MYTLIIDSATKILYEALVHDDKLVCEKYISGQNDHAKNIVSVLEQILKAEGIEASDLDRIVCGIGPGSYTGVRMGVTVAKMIGAFLNKEVYEISTLDLMASGQEAEALAMIDSRRGNAFCAHYLNGVKTDNEAIRNQAEYKALYPNACILTESSFKVDPLKCIKIAHKHDNPHSLEPNYLQETEAERNLHCKG